MDPLIVLRGGWFSTNVFNDLVPLDEFLETIDKTTDESPISQHELLVVEHWSILVMSFDYYTLILRGFH